MLKKLIKTEEENLLSDEILISAVERNLQIAIESCMDIARHFVAKIPLEKPKKENKEVVKILSKHDIITNELAEKLLDMAGMRNILVHQYMEVDDEKIYHAVKHDLGDIEEFVAQIQTFLDKTVGK